MPLLHSKSDKAIGKNIKAEMGAGKGQKQSIAIALEIQRRAKAKKLAHGGEVQESEKEEELPSGPVVENPHDEAASHGEKPSALSKTNILAALLAKIKAKHKGK